MKDHLTFLIENAKPVTRFKNRVHHRIQLGAKSENNSVEKRSESHSGLKRTIRYRPDRFNHKIYVFTLVIDMVGVSEGFSHIFTVT